MHVNQKLQQEIWFLFQNNWLVIEKQTENAMLTTATLGHVTNFLLRKHLINHDELQVYSGELREDYVLPSHLSTIPLRKGLESLSKEHYLLLARAYGIMMWDKNHLYCGRCGQKTELNVPPFERVCHACSLIFYPRISPSIIVLIYRGDELLMARGPHFIKGAYGLIAGFIETGESIEEAVHREVEEEVKIKVKNLRYFGSQPWPFPDSLMIAFIAEYDSGELLMNQEEIEDAGWYRYDDLPGKPSSPISIARKLIDYFIEQKQKDLGGKNGI